MASIYSKLKALGVEMDSHESDLYVPITPETTKAISEAGALATTFMHESKRTLWYELPFAFDPFWLAKVKHPQAQAPTDNAE